MKLLYFDLEFPYLIKNDGTPTGGAAVEWESWIEGFDNLGHDIQVLTWSGAHKFIGNNKKYKIVEGIDLKNGLPILKWFTHRFAKLYRAISNTKPDVLIKECANAYTGILAIIAKLLNIKFLYRVANDLDTDNRYKKKLSLFDRKLYEIGLILSDYIVCQNQYQYNNLIKKFPKKKITILYNPIKNIKRDEKEELKKEYIAWIGIFQYQKNLPALLKIAETLPNITFKIAGKEDSGIDKKSLEALNKLKSLNNVNFVGFLKREKVKNFLKSSYLLLNTSHFEGFSNTFLEAWTVGVPVISTKNVNPDGLITKFSLGIIAKNYYELPKIISDFISSNKYKSYEKKCYDYVQKNHDPNYLAQKFIFFIK